MYKSLAHKTLSPLSLANVIDPRPEDKILSCSKLNHLMATPSKDLIPSVEQDSMLGPTSSSQNGSIVCEATPVPPPRTKRKKKSNKSSLEDLAGVCCMCVCGLLQRWWSCVYVCVCV